MCTSLTYTDTAQHPYFARTMDFPTTTPWRPIFLPRHYAWPTGLQTTRRTRYAILGGGRQPQHFNSCLMADGINEAGLTCAELYLPHAVHYQASTRPGAVNLTPQGFINWVLGEHTSVAAVVADLPRVNLVAKLWGGDDQVYPFHWFLCDATGHSVVIEPTATPLSAQANPVGVLTNTPILAQHVHNLNRYLNVTGAQFTPATTMAAKQWLNAHRPLPTSPLPTDRFVHTAIRRLGTPQLHSDQVKTTLLTWLAEVSLPYDATKTNRTHNYTHYRCLIDLQAQCYTFMARQQSQPRTIRLTADMAANWHAPVIYQEN
ncbi:linear amide C-N hydrolase [Lactiplantibacillus garii]|uniref:Linear amide C-N hydrolase n=1 Tax=Lactiplantibacillus garii TaxID=2306423 RepID=A0A3R8KN58_9LACO|nr:linear amide C-N hydrolase [Lactiplantibacillus garii]RRK11479.1 linear amide C-N hydrolase [Lactiplantibacillus garii]